DEEKFLRKTIKLLRKMQNPQELFDVEHPVGIESRAQDIISALRLSDQAPSIFAVFGISGSESLELFTGLTYGKDELVDKGFVDEIARRAGGLPLVLEVWSRHFTYHERKQWPRILETLKRIPHVDIQKKLQMSYDSLPNRAKNLFLDIACFLNGMTKKIVFKVLQDEESGFFPDIEIQYLVDKGLIKNHIFYVTLHNVIMEMGQELVSQEYPDEPGKRTRLMGQRDVLCVLRDYSGTDSVRSINLNYNHQREEEVTVQFEALKKMSSLRFIMLRDYKLQWSSYSNDGMSLLHFQTFEIHGLGLVPFQKS
ncbi:TMV resistance protein N, partial [Tanacetum coccineum]